MKRDGGLKEKRYRKVDVWEEWRYKKVDVWEEWR